MGLDYRDLTDATRALMAAEVDYDIAHGTLYISPWLTDDGQAQWPMILKEAAASGSDETLAARLRAENLLVHTAQRRKPSGGYTTYTVPANGPSVVAEGEFNRFYVRALCLRSLNEGLGDLIVYRAKEVTTPRESSQAKIGTAQDPAAILTDLRSNPGLEPALGLPPGPGSGLSLHLQ